MASPLLLFGALVLAAPSAAPTVNVTVAAVLPEHDLGYLDAWPRVGPALDLALEALEPQLRPAGLAVRVVFASSTDAKGRCSLDLVQQNTAKLAYSENADVLIGLDCDYGESQRVGWVSHWGLPVFSASNRRVFLANIRTAVYAGPAGTDLMAFLVLLHLHFKWTSRFVFAFSRDARDFQDYFDGLRSAVDLHTFKATSGLDEQPDKALQFIRDHGRVAVIQGSPETLQQTIHLAQAQNMTNGDYVFIYLDILGESLEAAGHREAAKPWQSKEGRDAGDLQEAFQTVLIITAHKPQTPEYQRFQNELILRAQRDFGVALNDSLHKNLVAGCLHDVLLLYIQALNETLHEGGTKRDTSLILNKMKRLKIQGVTGIMTINIRGEKETDFDLWSMADVESGQFQVVGRYVESEQRIKWLGPIHWKKGCPPLNHPPCVFNMNYTSYAILNMGGTSYDKGVSMQAPFCSVLWERSSSFHVGCLEEPQLHFRHRYKRTLKARRK